MSHLQNLIGDVRTMRKESGVPEKEAVSIAINPLTDFVREALTANQDVIQKLARVTNIEFTQAELAGPGAFRHLSDFEVRIDYQAAQAAVDVPAERDRLTKDIARYEKGLAAAERQLGNEGFLAKAPAHIVEGLKKQESETRLLLEKARAALEALPTE
jgi:valyl-tRNA synthetase